MCYEHHLTRSLYLLCIAFYMYRSVRTYWPDLWVKKTFLSSHMNAILPFDHRLQTWKVTSSALYAKFPSSMNKMFLSLRKMLSLVTKVIPTTHVWKAALLLHVNSERSESFPQRTWQKYFHGTLSQFCYLSSLFRLKETKIIKAV